MYSEYRGLLPGGGEYLVPGGIQAEANQSAVREVRKDNGATSGKCFQHPFASIQPFFLHQSCLAFRLKTQMSGPTSSSQQPCRMTVLCLNSFYTTGD